jgi:hypothetical protein
LYRLCSWTGVIRKTADYAGVRHTKQSTVITFVNVLAIGHINDHGYALLEFQPTET